MLIKNLVSLDDLTARQIIDVLDLAKEINLDIRKYSDLASGYLMANLFMEPSTRTMGSFESAMKRMGGQTITVSDMKSSSMVKGETLADTIRIWSGYADLLTLRHQWEGSAKLAANVSNVPVINAGDGGHEHPSQTLCDLFTLREEFGRLDGLRVIMCGDLRNGRTVHSLTCALLRFGAQIIFAPGQGLDLPEHIIEKISVEYNAPLHKIDPEIFGLSGLFLNIDKSENDSSIYATPDLPQQLEMGRSNDSLNAEGRDGNVVLYMTRRQNERDKSLKRGGRYPKITVSVMEQAFLSKAILMHPLPRVDEISTELDLDPRSRYFQQAKNGVPVRMALIALLLQLRPWSQQIELDESGTNAMLRGKVALPIECSNPGCVTNKEPQSVDLKAGIPNADLSFVKCTYCEQLVAM